MFGGGGSCQLPLQVTTVIYRLHSNAPLGPQRNMLIRGVPATVYDEGRSIEIYSGRLTIDIFSDTYARARAAALQLRPLNAAGSVTGSAAPARLLPRALRPSGTQPAARDGPPAGTPLPDSRRGGRVRERPPPRYRRGAGASGRANSRRRLRNAAVPISAGTHSEIAL